ncbi:hypothetical protein GOE48_18505 [Salmonella enterica]|uniref:Uncharacterized protein n=1 Tax=Salmonella enterica TaxID=28901 RepID=A0A746YTU3_SALER|nr:hypothetical protein [Salmonella enterica]EGN0791651.1 hypothetical protein [Salmonella enterica]EIC7422329.1 hypothetical protein [Salmonella enterica]EJQ9301962.1 hypothetical protein [Salmonella enterica]EJW8239690.1 hypothetical protein [Salmonella enterica]
MAVYDIKLSNGWISTVNCANSESEAIKRLISERERMGYEHTDVSEIRRMKESYGNGGYGLIAAEEFHKIT